MILQSDLTSHTYLNIKLSNNNNTTEINFVIDDLVIYKYYGKYTKSDININLILDTIVCYVPNIISNTVNINYNLEYTNIINSKLHEDEYSLWKTDEEIIFKYMPFLDLYNYKMYILKY